MSTNSYRFISMLIFILLSATLHSQPNYTTPGTYTWTVPPCVTSVTVQVWGGGGGGGGSIAIMRNSTSEEACAGAGGGGGGGYSSRTFAVIPGQTYTIVVGAGGIAGTSGAGTWSGGITTQPAAGGTGGTSSFSGNSINIIATGGTGGNKAAIYNDGSNDPNDFNAVGTGGSGGTGSGGSTNYIGGNGAAGLILNLSTDKSGGGGGAAGPGGNGGNAPSAGSVGIADPPGGTGQAPGGNGGSGKYDNLPTNTSKIGGAGSIIGGAGGGGLVHRESYGVQQAIGGIGERGEVRLIYTAATGPTPTFTQLGPYCPGDVPGVLPTTSTNGITGLWSPAAISTSSSGSTIYTFTPDASQCAPTTTMTVVVSAGTTPTFTALGPYCVGGSPGTLQTTSTNGINGTWSPASISTATAGTTVYTFTPTAGQCASTTTLSVTINSTVTPTFAAVGPYCSGAAVPALPTTSSNGITGTWAPAINNTATTTYTFTPTAGQCATTTTLSITINPIATPTFAAVGPYCSGAAIPALPTTSTNGITGTWNPAINNTSTTTYTFTPTAGQCATTTTLSITITPNVTPTFAAVGPYCSGAAVPALPTTSSNGITGTWSPAINNATTTTYTFTPTAGQCAATTTLTITINPLTTPTFTAVGPYCTGAAVPTLPTTSTNGITGTWSPAINNTATTTYSFTPTAGQCAASTTLSITINTSVTPTFAAAGPYCSGAAVPALPTTSTNGITGTWAPAINNTATTTYTFTPTAGQCASTTTLSITINSSITPAFAAVGPYCSGAAVPALPATSTNGITGTWAPAINNTATTTYTFTPAAGQCATSTTLSITITPNVTPSFAAVGPYCSGASVPALPTTSTNGITGTWAPAINNTATTTYTFTPTAGQCASTTTLSITINSSITPAFAAVGPYCSGAAVPALPTTSTNGITGTWAPAINNTATTTYTFTPIAGQCATTTTLSITITPNTTPTFAAVGPYCSGDAVPALPITSSNGITGTWAPAINNTATTTYTFTPTAGQCATTTTLSITITPNTNPTFTAVGPYCSGAAVPALPTTSTNGITGTWAPAINNTATTTYTFTPTAGQCAATTTLSITITPNVTPAFAAVGPYCSGAAVPALPTTSTNGITGTWAPAINNTATTTYNFTPSAGQCATTTTLSITITPNITPAFAAVGPYCSGAAVPALPTTSTNGITGTWAPAINNTATTTYTFTPTAGQCATTTTLSITITPNVTPTFAAVPSYCTGTAIPALPSTSTNGITGTWAPVIDNTLTTTYTFTPDAGQCATNSTITIFINSNTVPTFASAGPYCSGSAISALPNTSTNNITGTWSPAINNTTTTTYTFTPDAGQCAVPTTTAININSNITPSFTAVGPYCSGVSIPALPTSSTNGITGSWSPAINNTATTTYTFTPAAGQCATTTTLSITITSLTTPIFASVGPYCSGAAIPTLPTTSTNGITGTWAPVINNTATTTYTFTPTAGQCATTSTLSITITPNVTPTFAAVGPYCTGAAVPALPTTSTNGINGTWNPAINNTATTTYTFTPATGQCASTATLSVAITGPITLSVSATDALCSGQNNGTATANPSGGASPYHYNWSTGGASATIQNLAAGNYCVTVSDIYGCSANNCAVVSTPNPMTLSLSITGAICYGSPEGQITATVSGGTTPYSYHWSTGAGSAVINNLFAGTYSVTVTDASGCSLVQSTSINQSPQLSVAVPPNQYICPGSSVNLVASPAGGTYPYTYFWNGTQSGSSITVSPTERTTYYAYVVDANGCQSDIDYTIVHIYPSLTVVASVSPDSVCPGEPVIIAVSVSGGLSPYTITGQDNSNIISPFTFYPNTTMSYQLTVRDGCNQTVVTSVPIFVYPSPPNSFLADTVAGCVPLTVHFNEFSPDQGQSYVWDFGDFTNLSLDKNPTHTYNQSGVFDVTLTVTSVYGCRTVNVQEDFITVYPKPYAAFIYSPELVTQLNPEVSFTNLSQGALWYMWSFGTGDSSSTVNPTYLYHSTGTYQVTLIAISDKNCRDTAMADLKVQEEVTFYAPTAYSPDNDGTNDFWRVFGTGISEKGFKLMVFDRWGEVIWEANNIEQTWDGRAKDNKVVPIGTYTWLCIFHDIFGNKHEKAGTVTVIR